MALGLTLGHLLADRLRPAERRRIVRGDAIGVALDGGPCQEACRFLLLVTTLVRLVFGARPYWNQTGAPLRLTSVACRPRRLLRSTLRALEAQAGHPVKAVVLDAGGINRLDSSAEEALRELDAEHAERGVRLILSRVKGPVRDVMERSGLLARLREERRIFTRTHDAAECARRWVEGQTTECVVPCGDLSEDVDPGAAGGRAETSWRTDTRLTRA